MNCSKADVALRPRAISWDSAIPWINRESSTVSTGTANDAISTKMMHLLMGGCSFMSTEMIPWWRRNEETDAARVDTQRVRATGQNQIFKTASKIFACTERLHRSWPASNDGANDEAKMNAIQHLTHRFQKQVGRPPVQLIPNQAEAPMKGLERPTAS